MREKSWWKKYYDYEIIEIANLDSSSFLQQLRNQVDDLRDGINHIGRDKVDMTVNSVHCKVEQIYEVIEKRENLNEG